MWTFWKFPVEYWTGERLLRLLQLRSNLKQCNYAFFAIPKFHGKVDGFMCTLLEKRIFSSAICIKYGKTCRILLTNLIKRTLQGRI